MSFSWRNTRRKNLSGQRCAVDCVNRFAMEQGILNEQVHPCPSRRSAVASPVFAVRCLCPQRWARRVGLGAGNLPGNPL